MTAVSTAGVAGARVARLDRVRGRMADLGVDILLLSLGADLPWLTGYEAMPLERLTMLVVPADVPATLIVPRLEAPRVSEQPEVFSVRPWAEHEDPMDIVAGLVGTRRQVAVSDRTWAMFVLGLQRRSPGREWRPSSTVTGPLRAVKDAAEIEALAVASAAADRVAAELLGGHIALIGRTERQVSQELGRRL
ncbi:MAG TPA: aminopeptidase P family N-terminal domain-containing protein, partial [Acidimicrobiales bacterium]